MARQILGKVVPTGEDTYDNNRTYDELCIVMYNGQSYISKKETRGNKPDNTEYWQQLVEKPVKGTDYFTEADKDEIVNDVTNDATNKYNQAVKTGIEKFDQNAERKTSDFNDNASEKTDTYNANADSATKTFTNNASSKTEAYNSNATEKLDAYNSNHTAKLKEYNDNATSKLSAYNTNSVTKTNEYNSNHTNKLSAYDTNASNKVDVYNTNADERLEEYNTNANNKIAEYDEHSKELNNKIVSTRNELERLKSNVLNTGEDTDTFIHLEDSAMAELQEIKVDGVCEQNTTTGKNLLNIPDLTITLNGVTTVVKNGEITVSGTCTDNWFRIASNLNISLKAGTYTYSRKRTDAVRYNLSITLLSGATKTLYGSATYNTTITVEEDFILTGIFSDANEVGTSFNFSDCIQLEAGSAATGFEPYTGGQPSPSPDYPQEIKTITDSLKVTSCGKNLVGRMVLGELDAKTGIFKKSSTAICNEHYIPYDSLNQYYIKVDNASVTANIRWYNQNFEYIGYGITQNSGIIDKYVNTELTSSIPSDKTPKYFKIRQSDVTLLNSTWCISTDPNYFGEYVESQIQAKLPENEFIGKLDDTYKNTLRAEYFPKEGQYHLMLDEMIEHITFTGATDENWTQINLKPELFQIRINSIYMIPSINDKGTVLSNYLITASPSVQWTNNLSCITNLNDDKMIRVRLKDNPFSTVAEYKNWLSTHNLDVYYALETPYTLDLGVIDMPMSYKDITNIFTDSDLLPTINAKYYRVFDKTIQNAQINEKTLKQEITDLNATVSALDNRLKALENKTTEEPTESEGTV